MADDPVTFRMVEPCGCAECVAERWVERMAADPSTPPSIRAALAGIALDLVEERLRRLERAAPRTRWERLRAAVGERVEAAEERLRKGLGVLGREPAAVIAASVWASLWFWASCVWALVVGGWSLRGLALLAGVGFVFANHAGAERIREAERGDE